MLIQVIIYFYTTDTTKYYVFYLNPGVIIQIKSL